MDIQLLKDTLNITTEKIKKAVDNIEINYIIETFVAELVNAEFASIWFYDRENEQLLRERDTNSVRKISINEKHGVLYKCFMTKKYAIYNHLVSERDYIASIDNPDKIKMKAKIILPLIDKNKFIGMVTAYTSVNKINVFSEVDLELLKAISPYIIDTIYKMNSDLKPDEKYKNRRREDRRKNNNSKRAESDTITQAKKIYYFTRKTETPDETLTFVASAIHDIRTPANTLFGFLDLLQEQIDNPALNRYILNAKESASLINDLTTSMLDRITSHQEKEESKKETINSIQFFSYVAEMFSSNMYSKKLTYNIFIDPMIPKEILTEPLKLKRIIMNLIGNAYKFTAINHSIRFSVIYIKKDKKLTISIKDTGIGIAKEKEKEIFKAFKQARDTTALTYGGTGLGLTISAEYVKDLGGLLKLESEVDKGSEFFFDIPVDCTNDTPSFTNINNGAIKVAILLDSINKLDANNIATYLVRLGLDEKQIIAVSSSSAYPSDMTHLISFQNKIDISNIASKIANNVKCLIVEEKLFSIVKDSFHENCKIISQYTYYADELYNFISSKAKPKILIVDDDEISISLIKLLLKEEFCDISVAMNGEKALSLLINAQENGHPFALAYLDNQMPIINGTDVIKRFRSYEKEKQLKPIFAVSISGDILKNKKDNKYFDAFAEKPFKKEDIRKALYDTIK